MCLQMPYGEPSIFHFKHWPPLRKNCLVIPTKALEMYLFLEMYIFPEILLPGTYLKKKIRDEHQDLLYASMFITEKINK